MRGEPSSVPSTSDADRPAIKAGRFETLGAWLHLWTPHRDVFVPPPPAPRKLAKWSVLIGIPLAAALAVGLVLLAHAREDQAAQKRHDAAVIRARELARLRAEQVPHHGRGTPVPLDAPRPRVLAARHALVHDLEH